MYRSTLDTPRPDRRFNGLNGDLRNYHLALLPAVVKRERSINKSLQEKREINPIFYSHEKMIRQTPPWRREYNLNEYEQHKSVGRGRLSGPSWDKSEPIKPRHRIAYDQDYTNQLIDIVG